MANRSKEKGSRWEREAVDKLKSLIPKSDWKRVPGSGALGTILDMPAELGSDITGRVEGIPTTLKGEAKTGYTKSKVGASLTLKREWLEKIREEANRTFSVPFLIGKFSGARGKDVIREFVVLDLEAFAYILNQITQLYEELGDKFDNGTEG